MSGADAEVLEPTAAAVRFSRALRAAGLAVDLGAVLDFSRALMLIDLGDPEEVRRTGALLFVDRPEELATYNRVFDQFWLRRRDRVEPEPAQGGGSDSHQPERESSIEPPGTGPESVGRPEEPMNAIGEEDMDDVSGPGETSGGTSRIAYSAEEALRTKSFESMTPAERSDAARLIDRLRPGLEQRRTRRFRLHRRGSLPAPRAMLRRSLGTGGDLLAWLWRRRRLRPRRLVAICDISGSMEQHSRLALRFVHALVRVDVRTESFVFGTRLTRITPQLRHRDPDEGMAAVADCVNDWAGGTQIGSALRSFNRQWARRVLRSSAIVIIVSDGWDRGDPRTISEEMALLRRRCRRIVWLNPLASTAGYEPRTAGMAAAFPFIDDFIGLRDVASLEALATLLGRAKPEPPSAPQAPAPLVH